MDRVCLGKGYLMKSDIGDLSRELPGGSFFNSYYNKL